MVRQLSSREETTLRQGNTDSAFHITPMEDLDDNTELPMKLLKQDNFSTVSDKWCGNIGKGRHHKTAWYTD